MAAPARSRDHPLPKRPRHLDPEPFLQPAFLINTTKVVPESPAWSYPCPHGNIYRNLLATEIYQCWLYKKYASRKTSVVVLSLLLIFFTIPHTLKDFAIGVPAMNGVPVPHLPGVIAGLFTLQGLALYELGHNQRLGCFLHAVIGIFWPLAAGSAQLILTTQQ